MQKTEVEKIEPSEVQFAFYPSGSDFIKSIIDKRGSVEITNEIRENFNIFARDYRWVYMPDMNYYESFFEANDYAKSFRHNNFGFAVSGFSGGWISGGAGACAPHPFANRVVSFSFRTASSSRTRISPIQTL